MMTSEELCHVARRRRCRSRPRGSLQEADTADRYGRMSRGTVASANGPRPASGSSAETNDFPTRYSKTVVTDDRGRYLIPDLPKARYWCGYVVTASSIRPKVDATPAKRLISEQSLR